MKKQISKLEEELREKDFSNLENPLFDLSDERVQSAYQKLKEDTEEGAISRDTTSWDEIKECVEYHISQYGDKSLIIIGGAAAHIWGAIPYLEQKIGARYVSATSQKLSIDLVANEDLLIRLDKGTKKQKEQKAINKIQVQMKRALGVVKKLGYSKIEDYVSERISVPNPRNVIFGGEQTGLHGLYFGERNEQLHSILLNFIKKVNPKSILYIHEDLYVENMRKNFKKGTPSFMRHPRDKIFDYAKSQRIPVEFGAFGSRDNESFESCNLFLRPHFPMKFS